MTDASCPRCGGPLSERPARTRLTVDREVQICSACGSDEAVREATGRAPVPFGEWPIGR
ncbi:hypothetical protein [Streptomyces sp. NPDC050546]|uniref:hypothetical protein n=1 Tax=Streptomyces sp. NPDC050546 TaxID=3365628 RepID=UPI0037B1EE0C